MKLRYAKLQTASLRKQLFHTSSFIYFSSIFSECITITSSEEALKMCEHTYLRGNITNK